LRDTGLEEVWVVGSLIKCASVVVMVLAFLLYAAFVIYIIYQMVTRGPASFA